MTIILSNFTPYIPSDKALEASSLADKSSELQKQSAKLAGQLSPITLSTLEQYMRVINSYYSNLIEGNATRPHEIRAAQQGDYNGDPAKRDLQKESLAHMEVQKWLANNAAIQGNHLDVIYSPKFIQSIHKQFYQQIPERLKIIKDQQGKAVDKVIAGQWRGKQVNIGQHLAPKAEEVAGLMSDFCQNYHPNNYKGDRKLISIMAAHHRFSWIHPFMDGNGRVGRLLTDTALKAVGLDSYGAWCLSRGLAKTSSEYKSLLATADAPRQGDYDGRGALTEKGLIALCDYLLDTAIDQVSYMSSLLDLTQLRIRINSYVQARNDFRVLGMTDSLKKSAGIILHTAFMQGEIERAQALELCALPERSARRLLSQLKKEGLLSETSSRSPLRWEIPEHAEAWYFPELAPLA
jgi:Fic family protein